MAVQFYPDTHILIYLYQSVSPLENCFTLSCHLPSEAVNVLAPLTYAHS